MGEEIKLPKLSEEEQKQAFDKTWGKCHMDDVVEPVKYSNSLGVGNVGRVNLIDNQEFQKQTDEYTHNYMERILYGHKLQPFSDATY